jgi:hypothetical protein
MNSRIMLILGAVSAALMGMVVPAGMARAQSAKDLVGTWTIVSNVTDQAGKKVEPYGPTPKGTLVFDANGRYIIAVMRSDLPKVASNNRTTGTADENAAIVQGSNFHFGTYSVDEAGKAINFRIENSSFPNWDGAEQRRPFTLVGDELKYTIATATGGGTAQVVWKRAK